MKENQECTSGDYFVCLSYPSVHGESKLPEYSELLVSKLWGCLKSSNYELTGHLNPQKTTGPPQDRNSGNNFGHFSFSFLEVESRITELSCYYPNRNENE